MGGMRMGILRKLFKPRKHPRFYPCKGSYLIIAPYTEHGKKVEILDISGGGCAFIYDGTKEELAESGLLSLVVDDTPYLDRVDYVTASDNPLSATQINSIQLRRRGVEFKWLGVLSRERLKEFIKQISIGCTS
jgi:acyl-[acyl carrier protein]--UDP-N-acetylglucosamine O-acyltransferase